MPEPTVPKSGLMPGPLPLRIATWRYDRTQALYDGRIRIPGRAVEMIDEPLEDIFAKAFTTAEYEVSELSFSNYLRMSVDGRCAYRGIPVFPSRAFRHGSFYVLKDGPVREPRDLVGCRIGVREFSMTAALAARGALRDQFGIGPEQMCWVVGDVDHHERDTIPLPSLHRDIPIEVAQGVFLDDMLLDGRLDAILAYKPIGSALGPAPKARRLFEDTEAVEKAYFAQTGIFPIMHLIGLRTRDGDVDPTLAKGVYEAFAGAQALASGDLAYEQALKIGLPWLRQELARTVALMGEDFWPCGFAANRRVMEAMIAWSFKDGMIPRMPEPGELFFEELLST